MHLCRKNPRPDIKSLSFLELCQYFSTHREKQFRAQQVFSWVYQKQARQFSDMHNLSASLQKQLQADFTFSSFDPLTVLTSQDQTKKFLFSVGDNEYIESVGIPAGKRLTACLSTQVGCKFGCSFCASGLNGFKRNLRCEEILNQIFCMQGAFPEKRISHIVLMGVGEPLDNYQEVFKAIRIMNDPQGLGIAARRMTVSTCGLIPQIHKMAKENIQVELAVSLHAPNTVIRNQCMPINRKYPFDELIATCRQYSLLTRRQVTFEYVLIKGINDSEACARQLAKTLKGMLAKVNLIPLSDIPSLKFQKISPKTALQFQKVLSSYGVLSTIRRSRGSDVHAACGQLRYDLSNKK